MPKVPSVKLSDGLLVPLVGFGTSQVVTVDNTKDDAHSQALESIKTAIKCGYKFIDTAAYYRNEQIVGQAVRECIEEKIINSRDELIIGTKLWCTAHKRKSVMRACKKSLDKLKMDYVDIYLIHWPMAYVESDDSICPIDESSGKIKYAQTHFTETWRGMEDVKDAGLARSIGISNFNRKQIEEILAMPCKHKPTINQVECHPYLNQEKLLNYCMEKQIFLHAHCPLGSPASCAKPGQPKLLDDQLVAELAKKYEKSPAQILIKFLVQRNIAALPKSMTASRIQQNIQVDFELAQDDMAKLLGLNKNLRYCENADLDVSDHPMFPFKEDY